MTDTSSHEHEGEQPESRLFLSCDFVGSTRFKQASGSEHLWQAKFLAFYNEFPRKLNEEAGVNASEWQLWKPIGDELVFSRRVLSEDDVTGSVLTWLETMKWFKSDVLEDTPDMDVKGGAFIATFPGPDTRVVIPRTPSESQGVDPLAVNQRLCMEPEDHTKYVYDYIGPSIDTGFRVLSYSSIRYFTMSLEVAWAIAQTKAIRNSISAKKVKGLHLCLLDTVELKGIWRGRAYPLFAIDRQAKDRINQALARFEPHPPDIGRIQQLCEACFADGSWPSQLYLPKSTNEQFTKFSPNSLSLYIPTTMDGAEKMVSDDDTTTGASLPADAPLGAK